MLLLNGTNYINQIQKKNNLTTFVWVFKVLINGGVSKDCAILAI